MQISCYAFLTKGDGEEKGVIYECKKAIPSRGAKRLQLFLV